MHPEPGCRVSMASPRSPQDADEANIQEHGEIFDKGSTGGTGSAALVSA